MTTWHPIPTFEGRYEMSSDGTRVRGLYRGSKNGGTRRDTPYELKPQPTPGSPSIRFAISMNGDTMLYHARHLRALVNASLGDASVWFDLPKPYDVYQINIEGRVRSLYTRRGSKRFKLPKPIEMRDSQKRSGSAPIYLLSAMGGSRPIRVATLAKMLPKGHPVRACVIPDEVDGDVVSVRVPRRGGVIVSPIPEPDRGDGAARSVRKHENLTGLVKRSDPRLRGISDAKIKEIREWWAARFSRRRHQVTVEMLCDLYLLERAQVLAIVQGVEAVKHARTRAAAPVAEDVGW